jgi:hypothetical protein
VTSERLALWVFVAYLVAAVPVLLALGADRWFAGGDEWDFIAGRSATDLGDLFRSHNEHWSTIPILVFKSLYAIFGVRTYRPYQLLAIVSFLIVCALVRVIMRRATVGPWIATAIASTLVLFGPGRDDILWAFQIGFTGAAALALTQLILSDHPGPIDRRDWLGLAAGGCALLCSGQAPPIILATGITALVKRGWKVAALHTVPLGLAYITWYRLVDASLAGVLAQQGLPTFVPPITVSAFGHWMLTAAEGWAGSLGHFTVIAIALVAVLIAGWALAFATRGRERLRQEAVAPAALFVGGVVGVAATAPDRFFLGPDIARSSRYLAMMVALSLPAFGYAVSVLVERWRWMAPALVALFLIPIPWNIAAFGDDPPAPADYFQEVESIVANVAVSPDVARLPQSQLVDPNGATMPRVTVGWLLGAERAGKLPPPGPLTPSESARLAVTLGIAQPPDQTPPPAATCTTARGLVSIRPHVGERWLLRGSMNLWQGPPGSVPVSYASRGGTGLVLEVVAPDLDLVAAPTGSSFVLCR